MGAYGGELDVDRGTSRERAPADVVALLDTPPGGAPDFDACVPIAFTVRDGALDYDADLDVFQPLALDATTLGAVADAARAVAALHASGRIHGDLRPGTVRTSGARTALVVPPPRIDAPALLAARLRSGAAAPRDVAFAAPEVVTGVRADASSDVYALAAMAFVAATGRLPVGALDVRALCAPAVGAIAAGAIARALGDAPRPDAATLADALATAERDGEEALADRTPESATALAALLTTGGVAVFVGALALALTRWADLGVGWQLAALATFTVALFAVGRMLARRRYRRSAVALQTVAAQLGWANAWLVLAAAGAARSLVAWTAAAAVVGIVQCLIGAWLRSWVLGASAALAFAVSAATWLASVPGAWPGTAAPLAAAVATGYAGLALAARRLHSRPLADPFGAGAVLWVGASATLALGGVVYGASAAWTLWPFALALGCHVAAIRSARLAAIARNALLVGAPVLGAVALARDAWATHAAAVVALALAAAVPRRLDNTRGTWSALFAASAVLACGAGAARALLAFAGDATGLARGAAALWPYALAGGAALASGALTQPLDEPAARVLRVFAIGTLAVAPTAEALFAYREPAFTLAAIAAGAVAVTFASARANAPRQRAGILVAIAAATTAPLLLAIVACTGHAASALARPAFDGPWPRWAYLALAIVVAVGLFASAVLARSRGLERAQHRALEVAALALFFGVPAVASLPHPGGALLFDALVVAGGGVALGAGVALRRSATVLTSASVLVVELFVQYFAQLGRSLPWGVLALGFGVALLAMGALYERRLKTVLARVASWD